MGTGQTPIEPNERSGPYYSLLTQVIFWALVIVACTPQLVKLLGFRFLPSAEWLSKVDTISIGLGALMAIWITVRVLGRLHRLDGKFLKVLGLIGAPFGGFFIGYVPLALTTPLVFGIVAGSHIRLPYTVDNVTQYSSGCRAPVALQNLPSVFYHLCVTVEFRKRISPGDHLLVSGYGTTLGIFPSDAEILR